MIRTNFSYYSSAKDPVFINAVDGHRLVTITNTGQERVYIGDAKDTPREYCIIVALGDFLVICDNLGFWVSGDSEFSIKEELEV
jgi:hypothetical protein